MHTIRLTYSHLLIKINRSYILRKKNDCHAHLMIDLECQSPCRITCAVVLCTIEFSQISVLLAIAICFDNSRYAFLFSDCLSQLHYSAFSAKIQGNVTSSFFAFLSFGELRLDEMLTNRMKCRFSLK